MDKVNPSVRKYIAQRADLIGAKLAISSEKDYGTQIKIIKPKNTIQ